MIDSDLDPVAKKLAERKARFLALNEYIGQRGGWIVSTPGDAWVMLQCLPGSPLPGQLHDLGYRLTPDGTTERILPAGVTEMILTEGSTVPQRRVHAGISVVNVFRFMLP